MRTLFAALIGMLLCLAAQAQNLQPKVEFEKTTYDFGQVSEGTIVKAEFPVQNSGDVALTFDKVSRSCGCTVVSGLDKPLLPGARNTFVVEVDTTGVAGDKVRTVSVQTNDLTHPTQVLTIRGKVSKRFSVEPSSVFFGELVRGMPATKQVTVKALEKGIIFSNPITTARGISIKSDPAPNGDLILKVTAEETLPLGELRDRISVTAAGLREPVVNIPLYAFVKGEVRLEPQQISFGLITPGNLLRRRLKLEQFGKEAMTITRITSTHPAVQATAKEMGDGKHYVVEVILDPSKVSTDVRSSILIETSLASTPQITVPIYAVAQPLR